MKQTGTELVQLERARNIPGSTYSEAVIDDSCFPPLLSQYMLSLSERNVANLQTTEAASPDREPFSTEIEYLLLKTFLNQHGHINFADFRAEQPRCSRNLKKYALAQANFQAGLSLSTKILGLAEDAAA